jgi:hypothetical protein
MAFLADRHLPARFDLSLDRLDKGPLSDGDGLGPFGLAL